MCSYWSLKNSSTFLVCFWLGLTWGLKVHSFISFETTSFLNSSNFLLITCRMSSSLFYLAVAGSVLPLSFLPSNFSYIFLLFWYSLSDGLFVWLSIMSQMVLFWCSARGDGCLSFSRLMVLTTDVGRRTWAFYANYRLLFIINWSF